MLPTTLITFIQWLLTPAGCGAFVFGAIALLDQYWPGRGLTGTQKFYGALALSIVVPVAAYAGEVALGLFAFSAEGLFEAFFVAYAVSQLAHRTRALQARAAPVLVQGATWATAVSPVVSVPSPLGVTSIPATGSVTLPAPPNATVTYTPPAPIVTAAHVEPDATIDPAVPHG